MLVNARTLREVCFDIVSLNVCTYINVLKPIHIGHYMACNLHLWPMGQVIVAVAVEERGCLLTVSLYSVLLRHGTRKVVLVLAM